MRDLQGLIQRDKYDDGGWCFDEKRKLIHNLVKTTHSKVCVEIGVYKGSSLFSFAEVLEKSGRLDSNQRPPGPKPGALPS